MEIEYYLTIPDSLIDAGASFLECRVYGNIRRMKKGCWASYGKLAEYCKCERRSVIRAVKRLLEMGFLEKREGKYYAVTGGLASDGDVTPSDRTVTTTSDRQVTTSDAAVTPASDGDVTHININTIKTVNKNKEDKNNPPTPQRGKQAKPPKIKSCSDIPDYVDIDIDYHKPLDEWLSYKASRNEAYQIEGVRKIIKQYPTTSALQAAVDQSILNGWKGLHFSKSSNGAAPAALKLTGYDKRVQEYIDLASMPVEDFLFFDKE